MLKFRTSRSGRANAPQTLSMAKRTPATPASSAPTTPSPSDTGWAACRRIAGALSFSRFQAIVGTLAGIASVVGATFSLVEYVRGSNNGELVAIVRTTGSRGSVTDAKIEVLTAQNTIVATLTPDATGRATQALKEGTYVVHVSHPRYAAEVRRIQVMPRQTTEITTNLRAGSSTTIERAVTDGVGAVKRALRF